MNAATATPARVAARIDGVPYILIETYDNNGSYSATVSLRDRSQGLDFNPPASRDFDEDFSDADDYRAAVERWLRRQGSKPLGWLLYNEISDAPYAFNTECDILAEQLPGDSCEREEAAEAVLDGWARAVILAAA